MWKIARLCLLVLTLQVLSLVLSPCLYSHHYGSILSATDLRTLGQGQKKRVLHSQLYGQL